MPICSTALACVAAATSPGFSPSSATNSAEDQAAAMNLTLGSPVGSRDNSLYGVMGMPLPSCSDEPTMYQTSRVYMASMFDPTLPAEVTVSVTIDVTFAAE
ncbi:MAG: hypothetical protein M9934_01215 [Thermomicrobiales bacterium]|nr:hypothetical protein [Thermomicrobiales bacterium]MCO5219305.1 hypothetical protein [Thermomicrobiales bacterium]MCO5226885.1 hypothetical protein [Thermomicrobiales bacterium]